MKRELFTIDRHINGGCAANQIIESEAAMHCSEKVHCFVKCIFQSVKNENIIKKREPFAMVRLVKE